MKRISLVVALLATPVSGATLELEHAATARLLAIHLMVDAGRLYLDGDAESPCRHAFVQEPRVDGADGRLGVTFLFSGRQAASIGGRCVGPGGTFEIRVSGIPRYADGEIRLDALQVETLGTGEPFFAVVAPLLEQQLAARLRVPLRNLLGHGAYWMSTTWAVQLSFEELDVPRIEVGERSLRLELETRALVR